MESLKSVPGYGLILEHARVESWHDADIINALSLIRTLSLNFREAIVMIDNDRDFRKYSGRF